MYVTLTDIQNGEAVALSRLIENEQGVFEVALCDLTYSPLWFNISAKLGNNLFHVQGEIVGIPDGYYNVCDLNTEIFKPHGASLELHEASGSLALWTTSKKVTLLRGLALTLGFASYNSGAGFDTFDGLLALVDERKFERLDVPANSQRMADYPNKLAIHRELFVHLSELSTSDNLHNGAPSTLLRPVSVENERCNEGRTVSFPALQYKRLTAGVISNMTVKVLDEHGGAVDTNYLSAVLHIRAI